MHMPGWPLAATLLLLAALTPGAEPAATPDTADDEKLLQAAGVKTDGPALVEFFRQRVPAHVALEKLAALCKQLGDDSFVVRENASAALMALGTRALPALRRAARDADPERQRRAEKCLSAVVDGTAAVRTAAAARVLAARKPAGAAAALILYLPFAEDDSAAEEIVSALVAVGAPGGRIEAALSAALADKDPGRRAAAALLLGRHGNAAEKTAVRKLLADADPNIRVRAAQGLLAAREKAAIPVLLALLGEGPAEVAQQANDLLDRAAGETAPAVSLGEGKEQRAKCHAAWETWWKQQAIKLDLTKADVDLETLNLSALARETVRKLVDSWFIKGETATAKRLIGVPCLIEGEKTDKAEVDRLIEQAAKELSKEKVQATILTTMTLDDCRERLKKAGDEMTKFLAALHKTEVRVVTVRITAKEQEVKFDFLVRVTNGRPRVVGLYPYDQKAK